MTAWWVEILLTENVKYVCVFIQFIYVYVTYLCILYFEYWKEY